MKVNGITSEVTYPVSGIASLPRKGKELSQLMSAARLLRKSDLGWNAPT
jgi:hypothetical protein